VTADRVRIAHPRTDAARRVRTRPPSREIDEQTAIGELYMASLIRSQRNLALGVCATVFALLMGIAAIAAVFPRWGDLRLFGISLPWVIVGFAVYPMLIGLAAYLVRQAARNEATFVDLLRHR
jgi:hypothetical protein